MTKDERDDITIGTLYGGKVAWKFFEKSHQYWITIGSGKAYRPMSVTGAINIKDKSRPLGIWQQQITADFLLKAIAAGKKIDVDLALEAAVQNDVQRDEAADVGNEIHDYLEATIKKELKLTKELPEMPNYPEAITGVNSFMAWRDEHKVKFVTTERKVYSKKYDYAGTLDFEAIIDGELCLGDFKSSNALYNGVRMQTAAYAEADMEECGKRKYAGRWAIRLSKYTEAEHAKREERKKELKRAIARIQGKEYKEYPVKPYQIFEAAFLDNDRRAMKQDFMAFLACLDLTRWNGATDTFYSGSIEQADYSK
jgi:hypothetical protein